MFRKRLRTCRKRCLRAVGLWLAIGLSFPAAGAEPAPRALKAKDVFDLSRPVIFSDDFSKGTLDRWNFSEDDRYRLPAPDPKRIAVVDAPGMPGRKAVRMTVPRAPNSFRAEISLPHEQGFQERWYGARFFIPEAWEFDPNHGNDLVIQWHGIPGNFRATYPNLEISIGNDRWFIRQSFGSPQTKPTRTNTKLDDPVVRGRWVSWVVHAKWSPGEDGSMKIWKDGAVVFERQGPNVYGTIGVDYTPYLKTGIYRPEWNLNHERKKSAFGQEKPVIARKEILVTDLKVGRGDAGYEGVAPPPLPDRKTDR
jgi:hypothetical protein